MSAYLPIECHGFEREKGEDNTWRGSGYAEIEENVYRTDWSAGEEKQSYWVHDTAQKSSSNASKWKCESRNKWETGLECITAKKKKNNYYLDATALHK